MREDDNGLVEVLAQLGYDGVACKASVVGEDVALNIDDEKRATVGRWCYEP